MSKNNKGWTERRRKQQACNARRNKPWQKSTGPRTAAGKARSRLNAVQHGLYTEKIPHLRDILRLNRAFIHAVTTYAAADLMLYETLLTKRTEGKASKNKGKTAP